MTPAPELQALRVAVAVADGWIAGAPPFWRSPDGRLWSDAPNYLNSRDDIVAAVLRKFRTEAEKYSFATGLWLEMQETLDLLAFGEQNMGAIAFALATADALTLAKAYCAAAGISVEGGL